MTLRTAGLVVVRGGKLLLAYSRRKKAWYLPGGKLAATETAQQALEREVFEELSIRLAAERLRFYTHISAPAYGESKGVQMEQDCFLYGLKEEPVPAAEISEIRYFSMAEYLRQPVRVPGVLMILQHLLLDGYLDN
jgi:8-oxo-dGTP pyrophosphatase MutT (NUDIX family)